MFALGRALLSVEMVPSIVAEDGIVLREYCRLAEGSGIFVLADSCPVALVVFAGSPDGRKELYWLPPIHFGRADGVECIL